MVALQRQGIDPASLAMVGHNCSIEGYNNIEAGLQYGTVLQSPIEDADLAAKATVAILDGQKVENVQYLVPRPVDAVEHRHLRRRCRKGRNTMNAWTIDLPDTVVVTGTASGLGQEVARQLLDCKVNVIGVDLAEPDSAPSGSYTHVAGSVSDEDLAHRARPRRHLGGLGYVGSAAMLAVGTLLDETTDVWRQSWEVNVLGNVMALRICSR